MFENDNAKRRLLLNDEVYSLVQRNGITDKMYILGWFQARGYSEVEIYGALMDLSVVGKLASVEAYRALLDTTSTRVGKGE